MMASGPAVLRNAPAAAHEKISEAEAAIVKMRTENGELKNTAAVRGVAIAKTTSHLKRYDNHSMSTLTVSDAATGATSFAVGVPGIRTGIWPGRVPPAVCNQASGAR